MWELVIWNTNKCKCHDKEFHPPLCVDWRGVSDCLTDCLLVEGNASQADVMRLCRSWLSLWLTSAALSSSFNNTSNAGQRTLAVFVLEVKRHCHVVIFQHEHTSIRSIWPQSGRGSVGAHNSIRALTHCTVHTMTEWNGKSNRFPENRVRAPLSALLPGTTTHCQTDRQTDRDGGVFLRKRLYT